MNLIRIHLGREIFFPIKQYSRVSYIKWQVETVPVRNTDLDSASV